MTIVKLEKVKMFSRREFLKIAGIGAVILPGCEGKEKTTKLPNGYVATGNTYKSPKNEQHYNLNSSEKGLIEKSYLDGTVTDIVNTKIGENPDRWMHAMEVRMQPNKKSLNEYVLQI
ncbi:hypothetical protein GF323_00965 [Candidatus Woesearchaeota archaeon]|nr:hypothetical protein [Candidatus Woesearchaeota archaeon]